MSDTAPDTGTDTTTTTTDAGGDADTGGAPDTGATDDTVDWKAEAEKYKALSRKHEERAKANANAAKERDELRQASMSEQEKAVEAAKQEARTEVLAELGGELVDAAVRAAVAGRNIDADALLDGLDRARFITEDGKANTEAIAAWVDRIAPKSDAGVIDLGQGARGAAATSSGDPLLEAVKSLTGGS